MRILPGRRRILVTGATGFIGRRLVDALASAGHEVTVLVRDPLKAQIVLLRYFTGLTRDETATVLGLAERTLDRHWRYIRAWLKQRLS